MSREIDWDFVGDIAVLLGLDWARAIRDGMADGTFIEWEVCRETLEADVPEPPRPPDRPAPVPGMRLFRP